MLKLPPHDTQEAEDNSGAACRTDGGYKEYGMSVTLTMLGEDGQELQVGGIDESHRSFRDMASEGAAKMNCALGDMLTDIGLGGFI